MDSIFDWIILAWVVGAIILCFWPRKAEPQLPPLCGPVKPKLPDDLYEEYMENAKVCMRRANETWSGYQAQIHHQRANTWAQMAQAVATKKEADSHA